MRRYWVSMGRLSHVFRLNEPPHVAHNHRSLFPEPRASPRLILVSFGNPSGVMHIYPPPLRFARTLSSPPSPAHPVEGPSELQLRYLLGVREHVRDQDLTLAFRLGGGVRENSVITPGKQAGGGSDRMQSGPRGQPLDVDSCGTIMSRRPNSHRVPGKGKRISLGRQCAGLSKLVD